MTLPRRRLMLASVWGSTEGAQHGGANFRQIGQLSKSIRTCMSKHELGGVCHTLRAIFTCTESTCANFDFQSEMDYLQLGQTTKAFYIFGRSTSGPCGQMNGVRGVVERLKQMSLTPAFTMDSSSMTLPNLQLLRRRSVGKKMYPRAT